LGKKIGRPGCHKTPSQPDWCARLGKLAGPEDQVALQNRCARVRETSLSVKGMLPRNTTLRTLAPAGVTLEPALAEPSSNASWAAQKKIASHAGKTLINFCALGNEGPGGLQKQCSHVRETATFSKRHAPVYVKQPLGIPVVKKVAPVADSRWHCGGHFAGE